MSSMSVESSFRRNAQLSGIPKSCNCGGKIVVFTSTTTLNPGRQFFRCDRFKNVNVDHVFKWVDEAVVEEFEIVCLEQKKLSEAVKEVDSTTMVFSDRLLKLEIEQKKILMEIKNSQDVAAKLQGEFACLKTKVKTALVAAFVVSCGIVYYRMGN